MPLSGAQITAITNARGVVNQQIDALHLTIKQADALLQVQAYLGADPTNAIIDSLKAQINAVIATLQSVVA